MKYSEFKKLILEYKKLYDSFHELSNIGFDFFENKKFPIVDNINNLLNTFFEINFTTDGIDWIFWFIFENDYGKCEGMDDKPKGYNAYDDSSGKRIYICYDMKSLFEYLKKSNYIK